MVKVGRKENGAGMRKRKWCRYVEKKNGVKVDGKESEGMWEKKMVKACGKENGEGMWKRKWQRHVEKKMKVCGNENSEGMWKRKW